MLAAAGASGACGHAQPRMIQAFPPGTSVETLYKLGPVLSVCQAQQAKEQREAAPQAAGQDGAAQSASHASRRQKRPAEDACEQGAGHHAGSRESHQCGEGARENGKAGSSASSSPTAAPSSTRPVLRHALTRGTHQPKIIKSIYKQRIPASAGGDRLWRRLCMRLLNLPPHRNVLSLDAIYEEKEKFYFVSEKLEGGELFDFLLTEKTVEEHICQYIIFQILQALNHMHSNQLLHRDIKPENLMFRRRRGAAHPDGSRTESSAGPSASSANHPTGSVCGEGSVTGGSAASCFTATECSAGFFSCPSEAVSAYHGNQCSSRAALTPVELEHELVLIDFDTCKMMEVPPHEYGEVTGGQRRLVGTYGYLAPEVLRGGDYTVQSDLWSVGVILYILMTGIPPLPMELLTSARASLMVFSQIQEKQGGIDYDVFPLPDFPLARDLCQKLLQINPRQRMPSAREALRHPWLRDFTLRFGDGSSTPAPSPKACGCDGVFGEAVSLPFGCFPSAPTLRGHPSRSPHALLPVTGLSPDRHSVQSSPLSVIGFPGAWRGAHLRHAGASNGAGCSSVASSCRCEGESWWGGEGEPRGGAPKEEPPSNASGLCESDCGHGPLPPSVGPGFCPTPLQACTFEAASSSTLAAPGRRPAAPASSPPSHPSSFHSCFVSPGERPGASASSRPAYLAVTNLASSPPSLLSPPRAQNGKPPTPMDGVLMEPDVSASDGRDALVSNSPLGQTRRRQSPLGPGNCLVWLGSPGEHVGSAGVGQEAMRRAAHEQGTDLCAFPRSGTASDLRVSENVAAAFAEVGAHPFGIAASSPAQACNIPAAPHAGAPQGQPTGAPFGVLASFASMTDLSARPFAGIGGAECGGSASRVGGGDASMENGEAKNALRFAFANVGPGGGLFSLAAPREVPSEEQVMDGDGSSAMSHRGEPTSGTRSRSLSGERERLKDGAGRLAKSAEAELKHIRAGVDSVAPAGFSTGYTERPADQTLARSLEKPLSCLEAETVQDASMEGSETETSAMECEGPAPYPARGPGVAGRVGQILGAMPLAEATPGNLASPPCSCPPWTPSFHGGCAASFATPLLEERRESCESSATPSTACTSSTRGFFRSRQSDSPQAACRSLFSHCLGVGNRREDKDDRHDNGLLAQSGPAVTHSERVSVGAEACRGSHPNSGASRREGTGRGSIVSCVFSGTSSVEGSSGCRRKRVASPECFRTSASSPTPSLEAEGNVTPYSMATGSGGACDPSAFSQFFAHSRDFSAPDIAEEQVAQTPLISSPSHYPATRPFFTTPQANGMCSSPASTATTVSSLSHVTGSNVAASGPPCSVPSFVLPPQSRPQPRALSPPQACAGGGSQKGGRTSVAGRPAGLQPLQQQHIHDSAFPPSFSLPMGVSGPVDPAFPVPLSSPPSSGRAGCARAGKRRSLMNAYSNKGKKDGVDAVSARAMPVPESPGRTSVPRIQADCFPAQFHGASSLSPSSCGSNTTRASGAPHSLGMATAQSSLASSFVASSPSSPTGTSVGGCHPGQSGHLDSIAESAKVSDMCRQAGCGVLQREHCCLMADPEGGNLSGAPNRGNPFSDGNGNTGGSVEISEVTGGVFGKSQFCVASQGRQSPGMPCSTSTFPLTDPRVSARPLHDPNALQRTSFGLHPPMSCTADRGRYVQGGVLPSSGEARDETESGSENGQDFVAGASGHPAVTVVDTLQALLKAAEDVFSMGTAAGTSL